MRKILILTVLTVLFVSVFSIMAFGGDKNTPKPEDFTTYKSPQGLFEAMVPKNLPLLREHKDGVMYGGPDLDMIVAVGVRLFSEGEDTKVDLPYIKNEFEKMAKDMVDRNMAKLVEAPKKYKKGLFFLMETERPPFPKEEKNEKKYYFYTYATTKNDKSLALIVYVPKEKFEGFKKSIDFMIDNLK